MVSDGGVEGPPSNGPGTVFMPLESLVISTGALTFSALAAGPLDGELVLLLHGFPQTAYAFRDTLRTLGAAGYRAVAMDQRGYSAQARPEAIADYAMPNLVGDVLAVATVLGHETFHVVGHDWGAAVAWVLAANVPQRVLSLSAISTSHPTLVTLQRAVEGSCQAQATAHYVDYFPATAAQGLLSDDAAALREIYGDLPEAAIDAYLQVLGEEEALSAALNWYRANINPPVALAPPGPSQVPTLYIWSDEDPYNCEDVAEKTANFVDAPYTFKVIKNADHWVPERAPERVAAMILAHLRKQG